MKNKRPRKPSACVHRQGPTHAGPMHAYAGMDLCTQLGFQKPMKDKFSALKTEVWNESHIVWSRSKPSFFNYIKPCMVYFQNIQKILRENLRFTRNSESKREFFTKHPQVNFLLIEAFSSFDLRVLMFSNWFCLIVNIFDWGEWS